MPNKTSIGWKPESNLEAPLHWRKVRHAQIMSDLFHEEVPDAFLDQVFAVMALTPQHTYQVLTKRPERMRAYLSSEETPGRVAREMDALRQPKRAPEQVQEIAGYPGYFVTNHGRVLSDKRGSRREMRPDVGQQGHLRVQLYRGGNPGPRGDRLSVHRLVLDAFVGPPPTPDAQACHLDGNPNNNYVDNLRWGSQSANWEDRTRHGKFRSYNKLTAEDVTNIRRRGEAGEPAYAIAKNYPVSDTQIRNILRGDQWSTSAGVEWPLMNCWCGASVENQRWADIRVPLLLETPAAVHFVSLEPMLGPVDIDRYLATTVISRDPRYNANSPTLDWVIAGGESAGPPERALVERCYHKGDRTLLQRHDTQCSECGKFKPAPAWLPKREALEWVRSLRDQVTVAGIPFFFKQWGGPTPKSAGRLLDGRTWDETPGAEVRA
jgi:protein gp37